MTETPTLFSDPETRIVQFIYEPVSERFANQNNTFSLDCYVSTQRLNQLTYVHTPCDRALLRRRKGCFAACREESQQRLYTTIIGFQWESRRKGIVECRAEIDGEFGI